MAKSPDQIRTNQFPHRHHLNSRKVNPYRADFAKSLTIVRTKAKARRQAVATGSRSGNSTIDQVLLGMDGVLALCIASADARPKLIHLLNHLQRIIKNYFAYRVDIVFLATRQEHCSPILPGRFVPDSFRWFLSVFIRLIVYGFCGLLCSKDGYAPTFIVSLFSGLNQA